MLGSVGILCGVSAFAGVALSFGGSCLSEVASTCWVSSSCMRLMHASAHFVVLSAHGLFCCLQFAVFSSLSSSPFSATCYFN